MNCLYQSTDSTLLNDCHHINIHRKRELLQWMNKQGTKQLTYGLRGKVYKGILNSQLLQKTHAQKSCDFSPQTTK